jgi:hypothetical protein
MALRILCNEAVKKDFCLSASEFKSFERNEIKFSQLAHSLELLVLLVQAKSTSKNIL